MRTYISQLQVYLQCPQETQSRRLGRFVPKRFGKAVVEEWNGCRLQSSSDVGDGMQYKLAVFGVTRTKQESAVLHRTVHMQESGAYHRFIRSERYG